ERSAGRVPPACPGPHHHLAGDRGHRPAGLRRPGHPSGPPLGAPTPCPRPHLRVTIAAVPARELAAHRRHAADDQAASPGLALASSDVGGGLVEVPVVAFQVVGLVAPEAVEGVLDRHRDGGALADGVCVVGVYGADDDVDHHRGVATLSWAVEMVDLPRGGRRPADHDDTITEFEPGEHALVLIASAHPGLPALFELEHAGEVLEGGNLVLVGD